ncbi:MAG: cysteine desulfurase-like protein [Anaerolineae bacterium]|nr:cysteine desulfurase-like protein [Anaerolineae bacterium]
MSLDLNAIRAKFPALHSRDVFFDNPGGTQIAQTSLARMTTYLTETNSNHEGAFATSQASDAILDKARGAVAAFLNAARPEEIIFGPNMTTLTMSLSRSLAQRLSPGDSIVVTRLDHDANIAPWLLIAEERGCRVDWVDFDVEDGTLDMDSLEKALAHKPKLVAIGYASNSLGTINPVAKIVEMAHAVGALVFVDAVQYAPHAPIDVQQLGCDFLACSAYKFFGPHVGMLYGRYDLLAELPAYKVRPAPDMPPGKFETGTQNHEGIAGVLGALEYLEELGTTYGRQYAERYSEDHAGMGLRLKQAMAAIRAYEYEISTALLQVFAATPGLQLYGPSDRRKVEQRVPTFSFTLKDMPPRQVAEQLDKAGIYVWDGNYYALAITERLGLEAKGGMVRVGAVHYNTVEEVARLEDALSKIS